MLLGSRIPKVRKLGYISGQNAYENCFSHSKGTPNFQAFSETPQSSVAR